MPRKTTSGKKPSANQATPRRSIRKKKKVEEERHCLGAIMTNPLLKELMCALISENKAEIDEYVNQCRQTRIAQNRRLASYETPLVQQQREVRETVLAERYKTDSRDEVVLFSNKLEGVVAFIDVWSLKIDRSGEVQKLMEAMGARVEPTFSIIVSHIIFQEGSDDTFITGICNGSHIVSVAWLESVKRSDIRVPEILYNSLKENASSEKITKICKIPDLLTKITPERVVRVAGPTINSEKSYTLHLINGVVTKVPKSKQVLKMADHKSVSRRLFPDTVTVSKVVPKDAPNHTIVSEVRKDACNYTLLTEVPKYAPATIVDTPTKHTITKQVPKYAPNHTIVWELSQDPSKHTIVREISKDASKHTIVRKVPKYAPSHTIVRELSKDASNHTIVRELPKDASNYTVVREMPNDSPMNAIFMDVPKKALNHRIMRGIPNSVPSHTIINEEDNKNISLMCLPDKEAANRNNKETIKNVKTLSIFPSNSKYSVRKIITFPKSVEMEIMGIPVDAKTKETTSSKDIVSFTLHDSKNVDNKETTFVSEPNVHKINFSLENTPPTNENTVVNNNSSTKTGPIKYRQLYSPMNRSQNWNNMQLQEIEPYTPKRKLRTPQKRSCTITRPEALEELNRNRPQTSAGSSSLNDSKNGLENVTPNKRGFDGPFKIPAPENSISHRKVIKMMPEVVSYNEYVYNDLRKAIAVLGKFKVNQKVGNDSTHLVVDNEEILSLDVFKGVIKGCWILKYEWLSESCRSCKWLPEEEFEIKHLSPLIEATRFQRHTLGIRTPMRLFVNCGPFYLPENAPDSHHLRDIIILAGGTVSDTLENAEVAIDYPTPCGVTRVRRPELALACDFHMLDREF